MLIDIKVDIFAHLSVWRVCLWYIILSVPCSLKKQYLKSSKCEYEVMHVSLLQDVFPTCLMWKVSTTVLKKGIYCLKFLVLKLNTNS
jgi:hypothetical protein